MTEQQIELLQNQQQGGPVECLGMTFESDEARREYFLEILREKLKDPEFRQIEGFPIGEDEDILALSDPPYYTACPNPFLEQFIECYGKPYDPETDDYHREPFAADVSEGKGDALYNAHSYHTKVPHKAIMRYILHYTDPGDIVLDGFAGSGMTGVAAQMCGSPDQKFKTLIESERKTDGLPPASWGARRVFLNDLSPAATFISANYNLPFDLSTFEKEAQNILSILRQEYGWMYQTTHPKSKSKAEINYTVWSEVFSCPECGSDIVFVKEALDRKTKKTRKEFPCPSCGSRHTKNDLQRLFETLIDPATSQPWKRIKLHPVLINYKVGKKQFEKEPDDQDFQVLEKIEQLSLPPKIPTDQFPIKAMYHGSRLEPKGFTRVNHLFLPRSLQALGFLWERAWSIKDHRIRKMALYFVEQAIWGMSLLARYAPTHYSQVNQYLSGVYYVGSQIAECSPWYIL
ncbi:MAG: DNA methyltransferase, partial [Cyanobacteria bacterium J06554_11]